MFSLVLFVAIVSAAFGGIIPEEPCHGTIVNCFVDPCMTARGCPGFPEAQCRSNYCGGCHAFWYVDGKRVTCGQEEIKPEIDMAVMQPAVVGVCPKPESGTFGLCAEMCQNCEAKGQLCCSNGCGHSCMDPVKPKATEKPKYHFQAEEGCPSHGALGACVVSCGSHSDCQDGHRCCSTGCGRVCKAEYWGEDATKKPTIKRSDIAKRSEFPTRYSCPAIKPGQMGLCVDTCKTDEDCNGGQPLFMTNSTTKCCSNGCGRTCVEGVLPLKSGRCPKSPTGGPCVMTCASHYHCDGELLCCSAGCGQLCTKPEHD